MSTPATQNEQLNPIQAFRRTLEGGMRTEIAKQLPKGVDPDRFIRTTITTVQMNPELLNANRNSLFAACMQSAKDGLLPDNREATIQIYNTNLGTRENPNWQQMAQYMPMVRGLIKKMYEAGCTKVDGVAVYEKDEFDYQLGDDPKIEHHPYIGLEEPGPVIAAYAIVKLENGEIKREVMPRRDIEKVREASKSSKGPGWSNWYDQFAIKAVLKRIYKQVPSRHEGFESVAESDNEALGITLDGNYEPDMEESVPQEAVETPQTGTKRLVQSLRGRNKEIPAEPQDDGEEVEAKEAQLLGAQGLSEEEQAQLAADHAKWIEGFDGKEKEGEKK